MHEKAWMRKIGVALRTGRGFADLYAVGMDESALERLVAYVVYLRECGLYVREVMYDSRSVFYYRVFLRPGTTYRELAAKW